MSDPSATTLMAIHLMTSADGFFKMIQIYNDFSPELEEFQNADQFLATLYNTLGDRKPKSWYKRVELGFNLVRKLSQQIEEHVRSSWKYRNSVAEVKLGIILEGRQVKNIVRAPEEDDPVFVAEALIRALRLNDWSIGAVDALLDAWERSQSDDAATSKLNKMLVSLPLTCSFSGDKSQFRNGDKPQSSRKDSLQWAMTLIGTPSPSPSSVLEVDGDDEEQEPEPESQPEPQAVSRCVVM